MDTQNQNKKLSPTPLDHATDLISWFMGSWWGVFFHTTWFMGWIILNLDMNILTLAVSLEAIFIGIFLLISDNRADAQRDRREYAAQKRNTDLTEVILDSMEKQGHRQQQILQAISQIQQDISEIKIKNSKLKKSV